MNYIAIKNKKVVNFVVFDELPEDITPWEFDYLIEDMGDRPGIGWTFTYPDRFDNPENSEYIENGIRVSE